MKNISNKIYLKSALLILILVLLQIPIFMVKGLIDERAYYQDQVINDIAKSTATEQNVIGPFIEITKRSIIEEVSDNTEKRSVQYKKEYILPTNLTIDANIDTFEKYRGIYKARLYQANTSIKGDIDFSQLNELNKVVDVKLVVGIKDSRGLIQLNEMKIDGRSVDMMPGTDVQKLGQGFHKVLNQSLLSRQTKMSFDFNFVLQGTNTLNVLPIGDNTKMNIQSSWRHPSFIGKFLPVSSNISQDGFEAQWITNKFTSNVRSELSDCLFSSGYCNSLDDSYMSINFIEPVDHYLKSERSVDYSFLIIFLVFASFFVLEVFQSRAVHPVQYAFAGLAAAIFYLLLISLSEHVGFDLAYLISAIASVSLLTIYASNMLDKIIHKVFYFISLLLIYALAFGMLQAESYALLMGSAICFFILSALMILTRNIDWYAQSNKIPKSNNKNNGDKKEQSLSVNSSQPNQAPAGGTNEHNS